MLNALYKNVDWDKIKHIGFDLDGTLYDEYEFVSQVYKNIIDFFEIPDKSFMQECWLQKGSSYSNLFEDVFNKFLYLQNAYTKEEFVNICLDIYRNFEPKLLLSARTQSILDHMRSMCNFFMITDGSPKLQRHKFDSLDLERYFNLNNVIFTGDYGHDFYKPNIKSLQFLYEIDREATVFFGDRTQDLEFSYRAGFDFVKVYNMVEV